MGSGIDCMGRYLGQERMSEETAAEEGAGIVEESGKASSNGKSGGPETRSICIYFWRLLIKREGVRFWHSRNRHFGGSNKMTEIAVNFWEGARKGLFGDARVIS
jgi:hypothetical protein